VKKLIIFSLLLNLTGLNSSMACTRVFWPDNGVAVAVARTLDWVDDTEPEVWVYPRGMKHHSQVKKNPLNWQSKYGSLVTTAYQEVVVDGVNEKKLAGHLLYLPESKFENYNASKPGIHSGELLQYVLDNYSSVAEVAKAAPKWNVELARTAGYETTIHIAVEDPSGDSAVIENVNGKWKVYHGKRYKVMTNSPEYSTQLANLKEYVKFGGKKELPGDIDSASRFVRANYFLSYLPKPKDAAQLRGELISLVRTLSSPFGAPGKQFKSFPTYYRTMTDLTNGKYYWEYSFNPSTISIDITKLNFASNTKPRLLKPRSPQLAGDVTSLLRVA
jgi:penicillin V acylase-like amidase (Ntn superfamily)